MGRRYKYLTNYDPRRLFARYDGWCSCGALITRGDEVVYYPRGRRVVCLKCGIRSFEAIQDEDFFINRSL